MQTSTVLVFVVLVIGGLLLAMKICFASKCDKVKLCFGLLTIHRDVSVENPEIQNDDNLASQITQMKNGVSKNLGVLRTQEFQHV